MYRSCIVHVPDKQQNNSTISKASRITAAQFTVAQFTVYSFVPFLTYSTSNNGVSLYCMLEVISKSFKITPFDTSHTSTSSYSSDLRFEIGL